MRTTLLWCSIVAIALSVLIWPAWSKPDAEFTRVAEQWMNSYAATLAHETASAAGRALTGGELIAIRCRAIAAWKQANPGGEKKLTLGSLARMRVFEVECEHVKGVKIGIEAKGLPYQGGEPYPKDFEDRRQDAMDKAMRDFIAWHPDEFADGVSPEDYARRQLLILWLSDDYVRLARACEEARRKRDYNKADACGRALGKMEEDWIAAAKLRWLQTHPQDPRTSGVTGGGVKKLTTRADGAKVTEFDNGVTGIDHPDGREETVFPNGRREVRYPDGRLEIFHPNGAIEIVQGIGAGRRITLVEPDGTRDVWVGQDGSEYVGGFLPGLGDVKVGPAVDPAATAPTDGGALRAALDKAVEDAKEKRGSLSALEEWEIRRAALWQWETDNPPGTRTGASEAERRTEAARLRERQGEMELRRRVKSRSDGSVDPLDRAAWHAARRQGRETADGSVDPLDQQKPPAEQQPPVQGDGAIDLGERRVGQSYPFAFEARNKTCQQPLDFRFEARNAPWIQFSSGNVVRGVVQGQTKALPVQLNFSQTPAGAHTGEVDVTCENCGWFLFKNCHIDKQTLRLRVAVKP
ncbi:MAG: T-complex 10 C-terminal domain-containing protein [Micropepsaceae bacterium]